MKIRFHDNQLHAGILLSHPAYNTELSFGAIAIAITRHFRMSSSNDPLSRIIFNAHDLEILPSEKQPFALLSWLSSLLEKLANTSSIAGDQQAHITTQLKQALAYVEKCLAQAGCQMATRALRQSFAKVYERIFDSGESRGLYETANELLNVVNTSGKQEKHAEYRRFAVVSLGSIYSVAGSKVSENFRWQIFTGDKKLTCRLCLSHLSRPLQF